MNWRLSASVFALLLGIEALTGGVARAGDLRELRDPSAQGDVGEPASLSTLDLIPNPGARDLDVSPTGAIAPSGHAASTLAPSALGPSAPAPDLPPEAPPPSVGAAIDPPRAEARTAIEATPAAPDKSLAIREAPAASVEPPASTARDEAGAATAASVPDAASLAGPIETALDALVETKAAFNPIGAGDWRAARRAVRGVYVSRDFLPIWVESTGGLTPAGRRVLSRLAAAERDGLDLSGFALPEAAFAQTAPDRIASAEATISAAVAVYALQATGSRVAPNALSKDVTAKPAVADPRRALIDVAAALDPSVALEAYNPPQPGYQALREKLAELRQAAPVNAARLPRGPILKIGMADPRVPLIRVRFGVPAIGDQADVYDIRVATAVAAFQRARGLAANGALTSATADALYGDPNARREGLLIANMEMWRWLPRDMGAERIEINIPDYSLRLMQGETELHSARVIVGKPDTPTPVFSNAIRYLLVNPIWRVPQSIVKKEMEPHLANDPNWLTRRGFKVTQVGDRIVVEQPPGEANALGRLLFMFPNEHAVYLHDTPSRGLFAVARRALSHGCVRVDGPARLAELVMGGAARGWTQAKVNALIGDKERTIPLPAPLPIHIEYFTQFVDDAGTLQQREDVYGLTGQVAAALSRLRQD